MNLNQVTLPSTNLSKAVPFYQKLGLRLIVSALPHYARFECPDGNATFSLHFVEEITADSQTMIYFEIENLDEYVEKLTTKEIEFNEMPNNKRWLWREARLKDPDGNRLILYYAGENRKNPPWRIEE
jgi:catechol 2,3-dioxygenase-like lactoylglutathione lyase family enzyme